jgi:two-component sensor histidine kinase
MMARPAGLSTDQKEALEALARQVMVQLDQRLLLNSLDERARAVDVEMQARRDSDARYHSLFNSLDAGFCVVEMKFDDAGRPQDYRFIEVNHAFAGQTGLTDAAGKWMRQLAPGHEQHWFDVYGKVAVTGEPVRFENAAEALDRRWYDVHAFRIGPAASRQVAILFNDISVRRKSELQMQMVNDELGHRMKNSMALVQAIASQTLRGASDRDAVRAFNQRIGALSRAHDILLAQSWSSADMHEVIGGSLSAHADRERFSLDGPEVKLDPKAALSLSLLLHELATNAVKYGALSGAEGIVSVSWSKDDATLNLSWVESGGPRVAEPARIGLGTRLIDMGLVGTSGAIKSYAPSGFSVKFSAPLKLIEHAER